MAAQLVLYSSTHRFRRIAQFLLENGVDLAELFRRVGIDQENLFGRGARVPREFSCALARELASVSGQEDIGLRAAAQARYDDLGLVGYLIRHSENLLGGLNRLARYIRLVSDAGRVTVEPRGDKVFFTIGLLGDRPTIPVGVDLEYGGILVICRDVTGGAAVPARVRLPRPRPANMELYRQIFGPIVSFDAPVATFEYPLRPLLEPIPGSDPELLVILEKRADDAMAELPELTSLVHSLEKTIARHLATGELSLGDLARELGMTERTLRRQISESGRSYRRLVNDVRREHQSSDVDLFRAGKVI